MEKLEFNKKQAARIDEILMLMQQSGIEYGSLEYQQVVAMIQDDDQIVKDIVFSTIASSVTHH